MPVVDNRRHNLIALVHAHQSHPHFPKWNLRGGFFRREVVILNLWRDESGGVISLELTLVSGVLVAGLVPQLTSVRDSIRGGLASIGESVQRVTDQQSPDQQTTEAPTCLLVCETQWQQ